MDPFADPTRPPGGASTLSVIARSPFDLDDDEDELEVPYVPSSDDNPLLAQEYEDVAFAGGSRSGGFSRSSVSNAVGATASNGTQNEIADALDSADYAGGSSSAQPTTMGDFEGPNEVHVGIWMLSSRV